MVGQSTAIYTQSAPMLRDRLVGNLPSVTLSAFAVQMERFVVLLYFFLDLLNGFKVFDSLDAQLW